MRRSVYQSLAALAIYVLFLYSLMAWSDSAAKANASQLSKFGVPITYVPSGGEPLRIVAILRVRPRQEVGAYPQWEEISIDKSAVPTYPAKGDSVTLANGLSYAVTAVREPDPLGLVIVTLNQRSGQPHA